MQEKRFPISGRNPQSAGASVRVDDVPCDFIMVGACNIQDLPMILSPLRSRIYGSGYEVLVETTMADTEENRARMAQFAAQEIAMDKRIPPATRGAVDALIQESRRRAKEQDGKEKSLTLRLRDMGGIIRSAGDIAVVEESDVIGPAHIRQAVRRSRSVEEQIKERYGSYTGGVAQDMSDSQRAMSPYHYWNQHQHDDRAGYG